MMNLLTQPWPWWVAGPVVALVMVSLLMLGRSFGVSGTLKTLCTIGGAGKFSGLFRDDWRKDTWNLLFVGGTVLGGLLAIQFLGAGSNMALSDAANADFAALGLSQEGGSLAPEALYGKAAWASPKAWGVWLLGGFAIGFGARWAGGCTSGHAITGLSHLQWPSLLAVVGFFSGGLLAAHILLPLFLRA